jgi:O-antigen/teichoic acid export membrane protein
MNNSMSNKRIATVNTAASLIFQGMSILSGLILPRLILASFGSEVNGLVSSLQQFLNYITLLDGGVSTVIMTALYTPLQQKDKKKVSGIIKASDIFFHKISVIFIIYSVILSVCYPLAVKTAFSWGYVASLCMILSFTLLIQYMFSVSYRTLLIADRRGYIVYFSQGSFFAINLIISVVVIKIYPEIHVLKLFSAVAFLIQPILYGIYVNKNYNLDTTIEPDGESLSQKWDGFGQNFALFIHNNTDVAVLTFLSTLRDVSVYTVYLMVINSLKTIVSTVSQAILPSLGNIYSRNSEGEIKEAFEYYNFFIYNFTTFLYACGIILLVPFVKLYTLSISDANYDRPVFGIVLLIVYALECYREPYLQMTYTANKYRETSKSAYLEAVINIILSILFVWKLGLLGVALGTAISVIYRFIWLVIFNSKYIIKRPVKKWIMEITSSIVFIGFFYFVMNRLISFESISIKGWLFNAVIVVVCAIIGIIITDLVLYKTMTRKIIKLFINNNRENRNNE